MMVSGDISQDGVAVFSQSPGELLVERREAAEISRSRIAAELGMTETAVREIEQNHFEKFAAGIYVRGYLKNYGKLLGIDEQQMMACYDRYCNEVGLAECCDGVSGHTMSPEDRRRLLVGSVIGLVTLGALGLAIWLA